MNKKEIIEDMKKFNGSSFITKKRFADYMGIKDPHNTAKWLNGLERVEGKYYFIPDIAKVLKASCHY